MELETRRLTSWDDVQYKLLLVKQNSPWTDLCWAINLFHKTFPGKVVQNTKENKPTTKWTYSAIIVNYRWWFKHLLTRKKKKNRKLNHFPEILVFWISWTGICAEVIHSQNLNHGTLSWSSLRWLVEMDIFYSGVLSLWLGVCSPEQPLVPTGVKSPCSVSGRTEAVKRGLHSSICANQWQHFLSSLSSTCAEDVSITAIYAMHSRVSSLLVNTQLDERFLV